MSKEEQKIKEQVQEIGDTLTKHKLNNLCDELGIHCDLNVNWEDSKNNNSFTITITVISLASTEQTTANTGEIEMRHLEPYIKALMDAMHQKLINFFLKGCEQGEVKEEPKDTKHQWIDFEQELDEEVSKYNNLVKAREEKAGEPTNDYPTIDQAKQMINKWTHQSVEIGNNKTLIKIPMIGFCIATPIE